MTQTRMLRAAGAAVFALVLSSCATDDAGPGRDALAQPAAFGHVHGLGINPADDRLYVASHMGVFKQTDSGFQLIADRQQDTMAFTIVGPDDFLASGHPDMRETDKPIHLGLIETTDAAKSWDALSLGGEADFHSLEPAGDRVYGYDSNNGVLKVTRDRREWTDIARGGVIDLAVDPQDPAALLFTDDRARLQRLTGESEVTAMPNTPLLAFIDWPSSDLLVGVAPDGTAYRSRDGGSTWQRLASLGAPPAALDVTSDGWYAATAQGVSMSQDEGRSWSLVPGQLGSGS